MTFNVEEKGIIVAKTTMKPIPTANPAITGDAVVTVSGQITLVLNLMHVRLVLLNDYLVILECALMYSLQDFQH